MSDGTENLTKMSHHDFETALGKLGQTGFSSEQRIKELMRLRELAPDERARQRVDARIRALRNDRREVQSEY